MTNTSTQQQIQQHLQNHPVVLYMKGDAIFPQCGFSQQAVSILQKYEVPLNTVNVLADDAIRQGIKAYADWPTIPQLYIQGEFIGGCDIINALHDSGELEKLLSPVIAAKTD